MAWDRTTMATDVCAITWTGDAVRLIDQTRLPASLDYVEVRDVATLVSAIQRLVVRGAPALGAAGAYGVALAQLQAAREDWSAASLEEAIDRIRAARPTAVNLAYGVDRVRPLVAQGVAAVVAEADALVQADISGNHAIGRYGADWLAARIERPLRLLTHCNAGALATCGWGTALGVVRELHARGLVDEVYVDETRPLLQGARLTAWELEEAGIPYRVQADSAASSTVLRGLVDAAIIGADRIAANGDTANKIGSVGVALACAAADIPFMVAAPWSTIDLATESGAGIEIELRPDGEVLADAAPSAARAFNPAFDVTPARLITALATETGIVQLSAGERLT